MTAMTTRNRRVLTASTVGQVAGQLGITVRTLHHYDQIGLLVPSERTAAGYRLYTNEDITRLQHVVVYRRRGFALGEIAVLLEEQAAADSDAVVGHLRRQREAVMSRLDEMGNLVMAIDLALEKEMSGDKLTKQEQKELFGDGFSDEYAEDAEQRWGETEAFQDSQERMSNRTKKDWVRIQTEVESSNAAFAAAMDASLPATSEEAMDTAEQHRLHIQRWFYDITPEFHRNLGDMYISDPRFTKNYESIRPGMAQYVRDAIHANADRAALAGEQS